MIATKLPSTINIAIENGEKTYTEENAFWTFFCISSENYLVKDIGNTSQDYCMQGEDGYWRNRKLLARLGLPEREQHSPELSVLPCLEAS